MGSPGIPLERLKDVVLGRDRGHARPEAMALLASSSLPDREKVLSQVLENPDEKTILRTVAAIVLGRILSPESEQALTRSLASAEAHTVPEILRSLGRIGGEGSLRATAALVDSPSPQTAAAARFASALISHRLGIPGHDLPYPEEGRFLQLPEGSTRPISFSPAKEEKSREVLAALRHYPYGIDYAPDSLVSIDCAGELSTFCLNRDFSSADGAARVAARRALLGVVTLESPETGDHSVSYVLMSRPEGAQGRIVMMMPRCSGSLALAGLGQVSGRTLEFSFRALARPGALLTSIRGILENGALRISAATTSTVRAPRLRPAWGTLPVSNAGRNL